MTASTISVLESWVDVLNRLCAGYLLMCHAIEENLNQSEGFSGLRAMVNNCPGAVAALNTLSHEIVRKPAVIAGNVPPLGDSSRPQSWAALTTLLTEAAGRSRNAETQSLPAAKQVKPPFAKRGDSLTKLIRRISLEKSKISENRKISLDDVLTALLKHEEFRCEAATGVQTSKKFSFYKKLFPLTQLSPNRLAVKDFYTTQRGFRMGTSVGGVLTGRGADILIVDDPLKPDQAHSSLSRDEVNDWFDNTWLSRLNNKEEGIIIITMQRLHEDDLVGHLLDRGEEWDVLSFPAIAEQDEDYTVQTATGPYTYRRRTGEVLDPNRKSLDTLLRFKQSMGSENFAAQFQQDPQPRAGFIIRRQWLQRYDETAPLPNFTSKIISLDTANKCGELNDFSVLSVWGVYDGRYYLLKVLRRRLNYPDLKRATIDLYQDYRPNAVVIEDKASGSQLIQDLKSEGYYSVKPYEPPPQTDKIMRLNNQTALFEAGKVLFPNNAPWLQDLEKELLSFPNSKFDDQVDSVAQALDYMRKKSSSRSLGRSRTSTAALDALTLTVRRNGTNYPLSSSCTRGLHVPLCWAGAPAHRLFCPVGVFGNATGTLPGRRLPTIRRQGVHWRFGVNYLPARDRMGRNWDSDARGTWRYSYRRYGELPNRYCRDGSFHRSRDIHHRNTRSEASGATEMI